VAASCIAFQTFSSFHYLSHSSIGRAQELTEERRLRENDASDGGGAEEEIVTIVTA